jgi:hypothetical protein
MSAEARSRLATMQAQLASALACQSPPPVGFDAERIQAAAAALATKRQRAVARAWPGLTEALGDCFGELFRAYARTTALPRVGGPLADGRAFVRFVAGARELPEGIRIQALAVDLRYAAAGDGLVPRRWPSLKAAFLSNPRRLIVALRVPRIGERWLSVPLASVGQAQG